MNTCSTCRHWSQHGQLSVVRPDGDIWTPQGYRKLEKPYPSGTCERFKERLTVPVDGILCPGSQCHGMGDYSEGSISTGPEFGCIKWEAKTP